MDVENTNDFESTFQKCLIGGYPGSGKTQLLGTLPPSTLIISAESGLMSIRGSGHDVIDLSRVKMPDGKFKILTNPADRLTRLSDTFKWLLAGCPDSKGKATWKYKTVCLDSLTEISRVILLKVQRDFPDRKDSFPMWGEYGKMMMSVVLNFRDLPYNVFMTVVTKPEKDDTGKRYIGYDIKGSIADTLGQFFDLVFYVHADDEGKRTVHTQSTTTIQLKDRSKRLAAQEPPDLNAIMLKIMEEKIK
jgi:hypothetical protein